MDPTKHFDPGEIVIEEGTVGTSAFIILSGTAEVIKKSGKREITMATLGKGQVFGEMGLIEDRPRSASVRAVSNLKVTVIDREKFNELLRSKPSVLIPIMKILFERLRRTSTMLAQRASDPNIGAGNEKIFKVVIEGETSETKKALDNRQLTIKTFPFLIGRYSSDPEADVFYNNDLFIKEKKPYVVSRNHLAIVNEGGMIWIQDRGSAFGTIVNGKEIGGRSHESRATIDKEENRLILGPKTSKYIFSVEVTPTEPT